MNALNSSDHLEDFKIICDEAVKMCEASFRENFYDTPCLTSTCIHEDSLLIAMISGYLGTSGKIRAMILLANLKKLLMQEYNIAEKKLDPVREPPTSLKQHLRWVARSVNSPAMAF